jgi:superfamily II RNA helicase
MFTIADRAGIRAVTRPRKPLGTGSKPVLFLARCGFLGAVTLYDQLVRMTSTSSDALLGGFLDHATSRGLSLYPAQEEAILELFEDRNVILNTPTGSGKSLVAAALHFQSLALGRRSVYTCPIKALVNEKWLALCREFGPENVGLATGDATVNHDAPILCCTAEILANIALRDGPEARVHDVVMDEFHYYSDRDRGVAWQIPLLTLPQARFLLMSATLGETDFFAGELTRLNGRATTIVKSVTRPVPLEFSYAETPLAQTVETLLADGKAPVYVVHFTQAEAAQSAQDFTSLPVATREEKAVLASELEGFRFSSPYGPELKKWLRQGIGLHHAGLLPKYRILVEQLAQKGRLKVICGTDTLGVGINVPIRTVLFTRLCKFDGQKVGILSVRDFHQIAGRAGRKGFDSVGWVVAQAPEHVIENLRLEEKAKRDGKKVVKRQPPDKNFVNWDRKTYERLQTSPPERLTSRFQVTHATLLQVLGRPGDGCGAMADLVRRSHESPNQKRVHRKRAWQLFRSLVEREIITLGKTGDPGPKLRVNVSLPEDFSLNQALSLFLLDTLPILDREAPDYGLDVITLVESILEDPDVILRAQLNRLKSQKVAELKAQGMEYDQRMEELEKLEHPKPRREFIYETFNAWAARHPWVGQENIRPKSIAREMFEDFRTFADYLRVYELQRAEGVLLRHLNSVYKVLSQTVPVVAKTETLLEMEEYLRLMLRQVDSSLLDEWEKLRDPSRVPTQPEAPEIRPPGAEEAAQDITRDTRGFLAQVRTRIFNLMRALADADWATAEGLVRVDPESLAVLGPAARPETLWSHALDAYHQEHDGFCLDPEARNLRHTHVIPSEDKSRWRIDQVLVDPDGLNDWVIELEVDLRASREAREPVLCWRRLGAVGGA